MKKYVFISNSERPSEEEEKSRASIGLYSESIACVEAALTLGYKVYLGVNRYKPEKLSSSEDVELYDSHTYRRIFDFKSNYIAYKNLMALLKEGGFEVIHCNTPIGGVIGRLCGRKERINKVIYTAHGFHFYKGAPLINNTVFKWAERIMARFTDVIITMNKEDYLAAQKFKLKKNGRIYYVPGVGIDIKSYLGTAVDREKLRREIGIKEDDIVFISMGDLIKRKNYKASLKSIARANNKKIHYLICGSGPELQKLQKMAAKLGIEKQVHFLGFRKDIKELLKIADVFLFTSYQEGLPRSMMEAMASGLPCIASKIRGNVDLIRDREGGYLIRPDDITGLSKAINTLAENEEERKTMGQSNMKSIERFSLDIVRAEMYRIYSEVLEAGIGGAVGGG
ncbi:MAG: glycosyltransferase family 4 protein [Clostridiaceae bacterium]